MPTKKWLGVAAVNLYRCLLISRVASSGLVDVFNEKAFAQYLDNLEEVLRLAQRDEVPLLLVDPPFDAEKMPPQGLNANALHPTAAGYEVMARDVASFLIENGHLGTE